MAARKLALTILSAGNIGGTLGRKWIAAEHRVVFGVSNPQGKHAEELHSEFGDRITIGTTAEALARKTDVVVMAVPGNAVDATIAAHAAQLDGKVIIDTANRPGGGALNSFAIFQQSTPHAHIYRAFNTLGWENFADPLFDGVPADLFYCGPDGEHQEVVEQLITDVGLRPMYLGGVEQMGLVDSLASVWFALVFGQHKGRHLAFKVLSR